MHVRKRARSALQRRDLAVEFHRNITDKGRTREAKRKLFDGPVIEQARLREFCHGFEGIPKN